MTDSDPPDLEITDEQRYQAFKYRELIEALEELVEKWWATAHQAGLHQRDTFNARCETWSCAADELQELIENHER